MSAATDSGDEPGAPRSDVEVVESELDGDDESLLEVSDLDAFYGPAHVLQSVSFTMREEQDEPKVICLDAAPMLEEADAGAIAITGSHAALFRGQPDDVIKPQLHAVFFSDGGVGLDKAGVWRLPELDKRGIPAGAIAAMSAPIGDARGIYKDGVFSHVNATAEALGARPGQRLCDFVDRLLVAARKQSGQ